MPAIIAALCALYSFPAFSQENNTFYYEDKSANFLVKPFTVFNFMLFSISPSDEDDNEIVYTAKPRLGGGISLSWDMFGVTAGYTRPLTDEDFGNTKNEESFNLSFNYYGRRFGCDLYIQHQRGFFLDEPANHGIPLTGDGTLPYYDSVCLDNISLNLYYIFSWKTFSLRAAFEGTDLQKKTSSSFLLMASAGELKVGSDGPLLLTENESVSGSIMYGLDSCRYSYVSLSPGYGWTVVFSNRYFLNFVMFLGTGMQRSLYHSGSGSFSEWTWFPESDIRFSLGYSSDRFIYGFSSTMEMHLSISKHDMDTVYLIFNTIFYAGYRFF